MSATRGGFGVTRSSQTRAIAASRLTLAGVVELWHVYGFAFVLGCVTAFDAPARQTFVSELVEEADASNAVALNSTSFDAARLVGPAIAGALIATVSSGWVFLINAASFVAVLGSLALLRKTELRRSRRAPRTRGGLVDGFRYVWRRPDIKAVLTMLFLIGTFGLNFPIYIYLAIALGGTPIGAPIVGWVADTFGPRWALSVGAAAGFAAAAVGVRYLVKHHRLRLRFDTGRPRLTFEDRDFAVVEETLSQTGE